jgi:hypothetical protein
MHTLVRFSICAIAVVAATAATVHAQQIDLPRASPGAKVTQTVGVTDITVDYSSPAIKGRKIWGGLVPYGKVWRAGANSVTKVTFSRDVIVDGKSVPAGTYAFFVLPTAAKWTLILNKDANQWGAFNYKEDADVLRVDVKPQPSPMRERLAYAVTNFTDTTASLDLEWEKIRVTLPIKLHTDEQVAASLKMLQDNGGGVWTQAARYAVDHKDYDTGLALVDKALGIKETWLALFVKAQCLAGRNNFKEAYPLAERAKALGDKEGGNFFLKDDVETALKTWKKS